MTPSERERKIAEIVQTEFLHLTAPNVWPTIGDELNDALLRVGNAAWDAALEHFLELAEAEVGSGCRRMLAAALRREAHNSHEKEK